MSTRPTSPLEGQQATTPSLRAARPARPPAAVSESKGAARQGVPSALRSDRFPASGTAMGDPTPDQPGIRIYAPPVYRHPNDGARWSKRPGNTPTAAYACPCGQTENAHGLRAVAALVDNYDFHRSRCPLHNPQEGRTAA